VLEVETRKFQCLACNGFFWQRFPGIRPGGRATEPYRKSVYRKHFDGISRHRLSKREGISGSTVERWFLEFLQLSLNERRNAPCPQVLGIDEHFFSRRHGFATTFCDLRGHRIHDVVLGRSEASLEGYLNRLEGKHLVRVVCMDLPPYTGRWCINTSPTLESWPIASTSFGWSIIISSPAGKNSIQWAQRIGDCSR
jgi:transposase